jgi:hypothetical protein
MLTDQEKEFIFWWERNRLRRKKIYRQLAVGLPLGVFLAVATGINYFSGWYTRANMQIGVSRSGVMVILVGLLLIVVFVVVFSARHKWEMNEQHYRELISRNKDS